MPASACEVFLGQALEDRNRCCLKKYKETQKTAATPATIRARAGSLPLFEFFSFFAAIALRVSAPPD
jgi:hypothetical protein